MTPVVYSNTVMSMKILVEQATLLGEEVRSVDSSSCSLPCAFGFICRCMVPYTTCPLFKSLTRATTRSTMLGKRPGNFQENVACPESFKMVVECEDSAAIDMELGQAIQDVWADPAMTRVSRPQGSASFSL